MPINLRGKKWVVSIGSGKDRIRESFNSEAEAKKFELEVIVKRLGATQQSTSSTGETTLSLLKILTAKAIWSNSRSDEKLQANAQMCIDFLGEDLPVSQVTSEKLRNLTQHFIDQGNSGGTINRKMSTMSVMLKYAEEQGLVGNTPRIPRRRESEHRIRFMTPEEEQSALQYCEVRGLENLADLIQVAIDTGFRRNEILSLKIADCESSYAVLHAGTTKSGKARSVPLTRRVRAILEKRKARGNVTLFQGMSDNQLRKLWDGLEDHMNMNDDDQFCVHMLRHTCASRLAQAGKNATFIMNWMGHSSIMVTQRYMHLAPRALEDGLEALEGFQKAA
ncbi:site-specific integrase [Polynucleobacter sp. MG-27-Goln-C1]|uniref:tyrosine-type recombinase/integrase n=1 Tax=Polynucleobacter sp. MG-27-Goln-C1 TaxID=1819726 RepID=UPI001C0AB45D|nr:site-specific integrase [Polynucleobacter sp. MG-27-Goln-C1]MBU3613200.1 site-specific integrase [Polynucleobacter sp. MG-27-Goln-C1]